MWQYISMNKKREISAVHQATFESIRKTNEHGQDYWSAREMQTTLGYAKWEKFSPVIEKAKQACVNSQQKVSDHFLHVGKMVDIGSSAQREIEDILLSRYACYLIVRRSAAPCRKICRRRKV